MHVVIQQRKETRVPQGQVYREIKQRDDSPTFYGVGEPILREKKVKYDIRLKDKGTQHHLCTVTYWDIVDDSSLVCDVLHDSIENHLRVSHIKKHGFTKDQIFSANAKSLWNNYERTKLYRADYAEIDRLVYLKFQPILDMVKAEYARSDEGKIKAAQDKIKQQALEQWQREEQVRKKEHAEYERRSREEFYKQYSGSFGGNTASSIVDSDRNMVQELVQAGYKSLSRKYHPDIGGDHDSFVLLGKVKDKLMGI